MSALQSEDLRLLNEIGIQAATCGNLESARKIFEALEMCRPAACFPYIGLATALLHKRKPTEAVRTLDRGLALVTPADLPDMHAMRALALHMAGRASECERAIKAAGDHPMALALITDPPPRH